MCIRDRATALCACAAGARPAAPSASSSASAGGEQVAALDMGHITFVRSGMGESAPSEAAANDESELELCASNGPAGGGGMRARSNSSFDDDALGAARSFSAPLDRSVQASVYDTYEVRLRDMEALLLSCVDGRLHAPSGEPVLLERFDVAVTATHSFTDGMRSACERRAARALWRGRHSHHTRCSTPSAFRAHSVAR